MNIMALLNALPGSIAQGLIWGVFAIGVYITFKVLDFADMTVDGSIATCWRNFCIILKEDMWKLYVFAGGFTNGSERKMRPSGRKRRHCRL